MDFVDCYWFGWEVHMNYGEYMWNIQTLLIAIGLGEDYKWVLGNIWTLLIGLGGEYIWVGGIMDFDDCYWYGQGLHMVYAE